MSKTAKVAQLLNASEAEARIFCEEVRKHFRRTGVLPPFAVIVSCLEKNTEARRSPEDTARIIRDTWDPATELKKMFAKRRKRLGRVPKIRQNNRPKQVRLDKSRVPVDDLGKCRHGVPKTQPCALCMGKKFKQLTGID